MQTIYLDNSATTSVLPSVAAAMTEALVTEYGNPSSLHGMGIAAERLLQTSRQTIATTLGAQPREIYFTSGGTEANNWALIGAARQRRGRGKHLLTTQIEHPSVLASFQYLEREGFRVTYLPVDELGLLALANVKDALTRETILVSMIGVNNEIGSRQSIEAIGAAVKGAVPHALFHVDWVQGFGKIPLQPGKAGIDLLSISAHKIHGPKGSGALYVKQGVTIPPFLRGGEQENKLRAGTENVAGIVGFGMAAAAAGENYQGGAVDEMGGQLVDGLLAIPGCHLNSCPGAGVPFIVNAWFEGVDRGEVLVHMLEEKGVFVSTGSACHSRRDDPSHVLQAMGKEKEALYGAIRLSLSYLNTKAEVAAAVAIIKATVSEYRDFRG